MYPFQSGEQMFGLEEDQEQDPELNSNAVPGSDEDKAGNQRGINGESPFYSGFLIPSQVIPAHMWNFASERECVGAA